MNCTNKSVLLCMIALSGYADDLIINGSEETLPGGTYDTVYVVNSGKLNISGPLTADVISLEAKGSLNINGTVSVRRIVITEGSASIKKNLFASEDIVITNGTLSATGNQNRARDLKIGLGANATVLGDWHIQNCYIQDSGTLSIVPYQTNYPGSGKLRIWASESIVVDLNGSMNGDYAGADPRGHGGAFGDSGGGGYGGNGGHGWWDAAGKGLAYGDDYTYFFDMGASGGKMGGGGIALISPKVVIKGSVHANGQTGGEAGFQYAPGGGSGGCILIDAGDLLLTGKLACNGGNGDNYAGPGAGGRIKIFYETGGGVSLLSSCSVAPGPNHTNKGQAEYGTIYFDARPDSPVIVSPESGKTVPAGGIVFSFLVRDKSAVLDNRTDMLFSSIELSRDQFKTVLYRFDQAKSLTGWNAFSNRDGDNVTFTCPVVLESGTYWWRAATIDRSVSSDYSTVQTVIVGSPTYVSGPSLHIEKTLRLSFQSEVRKYSLQSSLDLQSWSDAGMTLQGDGKVVEFYLPIDPECRFYRLLEQ